MSTDDSHVLAQAVHDLGAALWFGGAVMGVAGVNKAGNDLRDPLDKVRVAESAWQRFAPVEWAGIAAVLVAGSQLTRASSGRFAAYSGQKIGQLTEQAAAQGRAVDVQDASTPSAQTPPEIAAWQRRQRVSQVLVPLASGANIVLNAYLVQTSRPGATARGLVRTLLPG
jgi:hypothetical protein